MNSSSRKILDNIELILSALGLMVIALVPLALVHYVGDLWRLTAITALVVGLLHGAIFWLIRTRQRKVREKTITEIRAMLHDVVKNQLSVISLNTQLAAPQEKYSDRIQNSVKLISEALEHISDESLTYWQQKYQTLRQRDVITGEAGD